MKLCGSAYGGHVIVPVANKMRVCGRSRPRRSKLLDLLTHRLHAHRLFFLLLDSDCNRSHEVLLLALLPFESDEYIDNLVLIYDRVLSGLAWGDFGDLGESIRDAVILDALKLLVSDLLKHTVEAVLDAVLGPPRELLDDLGPAITDLFSKLEDFEVLIVGKGLPIDLWVKEVVPALSALFAIPRNAQGLVEGLSYLLPVLGALLRDDKEKLIVLSPLPLSLSDGTLVRLIPLVLALRVVATRDKFRHLLPVGRGKALRLHTPLEAVGLDRPAQKLGLLLTPVPLSSVFPVKEVRDEKCAEHVATLESVN